ncbi:MAG: DUF4019 domain-containing protein [Dongiaceae bacterium]
MGRLGIVLLLVLISGFGAPAAQAGGVEVTPAAATEVNVTTDSAPGWVPSPAQRQNVLQVAGRYLEAVAAGRYADAYNLQSGTSRRGETLESFSRRSQELAAQAGALAFWRLTKVTWTKDPGRAPAPGIYVAVDLVARFANIDRFCGYLVLYQPPAGGAFGIIRQESNYVDNATAQRIEAERSKAELDRAWSQLAANCPNYVAPQGE